MQHLSKLLLPRTLYACRGDLLSQCQNINEKVLHTKSLLIKFPAIAIQSIWDYLLKQIFDKTVKTDTSCIWRWKWVPLEIHRHQGLRNGSMLTSEAMNFQISTLGCLSASSASIWLKEPSLQQVSGRSRVCGACCRCHG
jgi:hypothetical protein